MKVAVFSAKNYDREFLEAANASRHESMFTKRKSKSFSKIAPG